MTSEEINMKLNEIIQEYLRETDISIREFSKRTTLSNSYIAKIVNGTNNNPSLDALTQIANAMGLQKTELFNSLDDDQVFKIEQSKRTVNIPLYSSISCGTGIFIDDNIEDFISVPDKYINRSKQYFANTASGDSMIGKGIKNGDILVFEKTNILENGEIGSFCVDSNDAVCKIFRRLSNGIILLESANEKYNPIEIDVTNECFRIIGKYKFKLSIEQ